MTAKIASESGLKILVLDRKTGINKIHTTDRGVINENDHLFSRVNQFNLKCQRESRFSQ
jgi:hypothetical protein